MKIVIVGTAYPLRGGIAHYLALLAGHLKKRHDVETITFKRQYPALLFPGKTQEEAGEGLQVSPAPQLVDSINPLNWVAVAREIRRRAPDLVIFKYWLPFFGPCFGTIARLVRKNSRTKVLYICDNIIPHERRPGDVLFTKYAFKQADYFIVQSDNVERELNKLFPGVRYRKVPHPVYEIFGPRLPQDEARRALGIAAAARVMLFFGYVRQYKGLMVLIDALRRVIDSGFSREDVLLLVVGEFYDDEKKYRDRAHALGLEESVRFVSEYIPNQEVSTYFSASDLVVLPYLSATQSGIAQIAYHFDKPVIATDVGGLAEVVIDEKTGFIVPPNDPLALAERIMRFYTEKREQEFSTKVQEEKRKYSWDRLVEAIEQLAETKPAGT